MRRIAGSTAWRLAAGALGEAVAAEGAAAASPAAPAGVGARAARPASHLLRWAGLPPVPGMRISTVSTAFSSLAAPVGPPKLPLSAAAAAAAPLRAAPALLGRAGLVLPLHTAAVRQPSSNTSLQPWEPSWAQRPGPAAPAGDAPPTTASGEAVQPAAPPPDSVESSPQRQFERWLDDMHEQGFQVQLDPKQSSVELLGPGGQKMRLWLKQERFAHLEWVLAGSVALFFALGGKEAGWLAALMYMGIWAVFPRLICIAMYLGMVAVLEKMFGPVLGS